MSTRYVYSVYNTTVAEREESKHIHLWETSEYRNVYVVFCNAYEQTVKTNRNGDPVAFYTPLDDPEGEHVIHPNYTYPNKYWSLARDTLAYKYAIIYKTSASSFADEVNAVSECYLLEVIPGVSGGFWNMIANLVGSDDELYAGNSSSDRNFAKDSNPVTEFSKVEKSFYKSGGVIAKGSTHLKTASSRTRLAEGAFSESAAWRWRVYQGSDTIDPIAVTYSKADLYHGDTVEIRVSARTPTYGGTVYYQYQYTIDGGTWTSLGSRTTSTTATVVIPDGAKQFQARMVASDGWGFTSSSYVYGPSLEISQLKAYAIVGGNVRKLSKGWCVINGVSKALSKGYVTIDGVWRKLF